jgi:hypothetical protein
MLEYVFFDAGSRERFAAFIRAHGAECGFSDGDALIALVPEDLDDAIGDAIDEEYERLLQATPALLGYGMIEHSAAGVRVLLGDGTPCQIRMDPDLMARMLGCISLEELRDLVQTIAEAVENPDDRPLCHT